MKNLLVIVFFCLFISCSTENDNTSSENINSKSIVSQEHLISIENNTASKKYNDALVAYLNKNKYPDSVEELSSMIQFILDQYVASNKAESITYQQILRINNKPINELSTLLGNSLLGMEAKVQLETFIQNLINLQGKDFKEISSYLVFFEEEVLKNTVLTDHEKESILAVSTVSLYSFQNEAKRKDKDWETSVGNRKTPPFFEPGQRSIISVIAVIQKII
ncbi:hypothetical protein [Flavobacterium sp. JAS]|uniref:hypothetical protein n=1 Tax=Flavobacterium sp. JAS TaxID=2897329 RepID=UPI001E415004|nr:hypothetical protein [Flavobacterium sp. JAS]MCD0472501.1 hypothetical protein [Flavobacterium sp. JAS]